MDKIARERQRGFHILAGAAGCRSRKIESHVGLFEESADGVQVTTDVWHTAIVTRSKRLMFLAKNRINAELGHYPPEGEMTPYAILALTLSLKSCPGTTERWLSGRKQRFAKPS